MASISFDKCWFPLPIIISVCSFQSQVASRVSTDFGRHGVDCSIEDTDNGCLDAEGDDVRRQRSFDGRVSTCCTSSLWTNAQDQCRRCCNGGGLEAQAVSAFWDSQSSNGLLLLRDEQSQLAGMAGVVVEKLPGFQDEVPRVCYLVIDPRLHGQGFGSMLVRQCEDWAAARGHRAIWLFVLRHKERLCQWYSKMGYQTVEEHRTATVPVAGQGKMEGTVQMLGREVTLKRKPLWVNLFVHFMRIWWRSFWDILCAFDEDHSETLRSFKFVHFNVWSTTETDRLKLGDFMDLDKIYIYRS